MIPPLFLFPFPASSDTRVLLKFHDHMINRLYVSTLLTHEQKKYVNVNACFEMQAGMITREKLKQQSFAFAPHTHKCMNSLFSLFPEFLLVIKFVARNKQTQKKESRDSW